MGADVEIEVLKSVVNKLDSSLEKISEVSNSIGRLLAVHDERLNSLEKVSDKREKEIDELHSRITTQTKEIVDKLESMESRIEKRMTDGAAASTAQHLTIQNELKADITKIDNRLLIVERWRWYLIGGAAMLGYLIGHLGDIKKFLM